MSIFVISQFWATLSKVEVLFCNFQINQCVLLNDMDERSKITIFNDNICISAFQHFCSVSWTKEQKAMAFDQFVLEQFFDWNCQWHWYLSVWQDIKGDFKPTNCLVNQQILMFWCKIFFYCKTVKDICCFATCLASWCHPTTHALKS